MISICLAYRKVDFKDDYYVVLVDACAPLSAFAGSKGCRAGTGVWLEKRLWPEQAVISICEAKSLVNDFASIQGLYRTIRYKPF